MGRARRLGVTAWLWGLFGLLVAAVLAVALYRVGPLRPPPPTLVAPLDPLCDLRTGPCHARFPNGAQVAFGIEPRAIPILHPLTLTVKAKGVDVAAVEVDFAGTDMDMGFNRVRLEPGGTGLYHGQGMLPLCVRTRMAWEAKVILHTPSGAWVAPFRFATDRSRPERRVGN